MSERRLSPEEQEQLAETLRAKLSGRRLRPRRWFVAALAIVAIALAVVRWGLRTPPVLPPVMLVAFDALALDDRSEVVAQLVAPGNPDAKVEGLNIVWNSQGIEPAQSGASTADARGKGRFTLSVQPQGKTYSILASFLDPYGAYRRDDRAAIVVPGDGPIAVVAIDELVGGEKVDWLGGNATATAPKLEPGTLKRSALTLYCSGNVDAATYRGMRLWVMEHAGSKRIPPGLLLNEAASAVAERLTLRRPDGNVSRPLAIP